MIILGIALISLLIFAAIMLLSALRDTRQLTQQLEMSKTEIYFWKEDEEGNKIKITKEEFEQMIGNKVL